MGGVSPFGVLTVMLTPLYRSSTRVLDKDSAREFPIGRGDSTTTTVNMSLPSTPGSVASILPAARSVSAVKCYYLAPHVTTPPPQWLTGEGVPDPPRGQMVGWGGGSRPPRGSVPNVVNTQDSQEQAS
eukprot:289039-Prorocentrum_minimum.AAC.1